MIAASLLLASWVLVLSPLFRQGGDDLTSQVISLAYPIGDVVVGTIVLFVLARARMGRGTRGTPLPLLGGGLVAIAVADSGFVYLTASGSYSSGALIDAGWFLGYLLVLLAARKPEDEEVDEEERPRPASTGWGCSCPTSRWWGRWRSARWPRSSRASWTISPPGPGPSSSSPWSGARCSACSRTPRWPASWRPGWWSGRPSCAPPSSASRPWSSTARRS